MDMIRTEGPIYCRLSVYKNEDWVDAVPQFVDEQGAPFDLTGCDFDLYIVPNLNYAPAIAHLTTGSSGAQIIIEDADQGLVVINVGRADMAGWPIGRWFQFLNLTFTDPDLGPTVKTIWRGPCDIFPGLVSDP